MSDIDIELLKRAKDGDQFAIDEILTENKHLVSTIARKYYLIGGEKDDLIQEGMIGFFKAINVYDFDKNHNFISFAITLIEREIISAIRHNNSHKNSPLSESVFVEDNDILPADGCPEEDILHFETMHELNDEITNKLSGFERKVVKFYLKGYAYTDIAKILNKSPKSIDNALNRIKHKLNFLKERI